MNTKKMTDPIPRLIILSDLWGKEKSGWLKHYTTHLEHFFQIQFYDSCVLAEVNTSNYSKENLHAQFVEGGIEKAVKNLVQKEKEILHVLAFSIGGSIAWKAILSGLNAESLFAISSTRIRNENEKPIGIVELIYGEKDEYRPDDNWFQKLKIEKQLIENHGHDLYKNKEIAKLVCEKIIEKIITDSKDN